MILANYTKEFSYNLKLAAPVMLGMLGHTFVGFIDNVMVGQLGTAELAAVSLGNSFIFVAMSLGIGFSTAITPLVAEAHSEKNTNKGQRIFKHGLILCTVLSVLLTLGILLSKPLMYVLDQPDAVVALAIPYLNWAGISLIPLIIFQALKQFSDGLSLTKYPMYATIVANILNVILNYLLIFGAFGFPKMGVVGAAIGTLLSRIVMLLFLWLILSKSNHSKFYIINTKLFNLKRQPIKQMIFLGLPSAFQMFFEVAIFTVAIWLSGNISTNAQAANQIALNLASMTFMVAIGLSVTAMIRVGNQKGLKDFVNLKRIAESIFLMGLLFAILFALMFIILRNWLPLLYVDIHNTADQINTAEVVNTAAIQLLMAAIFQITDSAQVIALGALRGLQDVKIPTLITFVAYWLIGFPICYILGQQDILGSLGIWIGLTIGLSSAAILLFIRFHYLSKGLILNNLYK